MQISVVIPVHNEEEYIEQCLKSLMAQEEKPDEIIVVNNNSTDKTAEIVKKFAVTMIHQPVQGITPTRNAGFDAAQYEIIARCDADTILPPDWIKHIKNRFETDSIDALTGTAYFHDVEWLEKKTLFQNMLFFFF